MRGRELESFEIRGVGGSYLVPLPYSSVFLTRLFIMLQLIQEEISHKKEGGERIGTYTKQEAFYKGGGMVQQHRLTLLLNHHICILCIFSSQLF